MEEIISKKWPETADEKVKIVRGNLLLAENNENLALIFSETGKENAGIIGIATKACGQIEEIIQEGKLNYGYQIIEKKISNKIYLRFMATEVKERI